MTGKKLTLTLTRMRCLFNSSKYVVEKKTDTLNIAQIEIFFRKKLVINFCHWTFRIFCFSQWRHVDSTHAGSVKVNLFPSQQISCHTGSYQCFLLILNFSSNIYNYWTSDWFFRCFGGYHINDTAGWFHTVSCVRSKRLWRHGLMALISLVEFLWWF